jgi:hypothetical protein
MPARRRVRCPGVRQARRRGRLSGVVALGVALVMAGCGGSPPRELAGFALGESQEEVLARARPGGFTCHLRGTVPRVTACDGDTDEGHARVVVRNDATVFISLDLDPGGRNPQRVMRRYVRRFGTPAWTERPYPPAEADRFHTLWLDRDSTRALAMICSGRGLAPPCTAELTRTTPRQVQTRLDSILNIRRQM